MTSAIELERVTKIYRRYGGRQFATLKSALLQRSILRDLQPSEVFSALTDVSFTVPKGSNSGIYNRGLYEIQVLDSYGKPELAVLDCGALYERTIPKVNASKPPGEWQTFDIKMQGKKMSLVWNGVEILRDYDVRYGETDKGAFERLNKENASKPEALRVKLEARDGRYVGYFGEGGTRSSLPGVDRAGPILLQGDHGPVAYRQIKIRPLGER